MQVERDAQIGEAILNSADGLLDPVRRGPGHGIRQRYLLEPDALFRGDVGRSFHERHHTSGGDIAFEVATEGGHDDCTLNRHLKAVVLRHVSALGGGLLLERAVLVALRKASEAHSAISPVTVRFLQARARLRPFSLRLRPV